MAHNTELRLKFAGRLDKDKKEFFVTVSRLPAHVDLSNALLLFFPFEDEEKGKFGGELVIRTYTPPKDGEEKDPQGSR